MHLDIGHHDVKFENTVITSVNFWNSTSTEKEFLKLRDFHLRICIEENWEELLENGIPQELMDAIVLNTFKECPEYPIFPGVQNFVVDVQGLEDYVESKPNLMESVQVYFPNLIFSETSRSLL